MTLFCVRIVVLLGIATFFPVLIRGLSSTSFAWPLFQVVRIRLTTERGINGPNQYLHRRGPKGLIVAINPVLIDMKLELGGVSDIDVNLLEVCYDISSYDASFQNRIGYESQCSSLLELSNPPVFQNLEQGSQHVFKAWLNQSGQKSAVSSLMFEIGTVEQHLSSASTNSAYQSTVPYDFEYISNVKKCVEEKSRLFVSKSSNIDNYNIEKRAGLFAEKGYVHQDLGFLGAIVRKVLDEKQIHDVGSLVHCAQTILRSDNSHFDGAIAREDFGADRDDTYEPHLLVNLNPFLNSDILPEVKDRIYEAVHVAALTGKSTHKVFDDQTKDIETLIHNKDYLLGFRVVEHISYPAGVGLDAHEDEDSSLTISILISDSSEYEGGKFSLLGHEVTEDFHPGDGLVFESTRAHQVTSVTSGIRKVLVVELWPFPDGAIPTRGAIPQRYPPPPQEVAGFAPSSSGYKNNKEEEEEEKEEEEADGSQFIDSYLVMQGGLVATGGLPVLNTAATETMLFTWPEAIEACDRILTCLSFSFLHTTPWVGKREEEHIQLFVDFKREASPIRIKGGMDSVSGAYGVVSNVNGIPRWTAIKPWPIKTLLNEWMLSSMSPAPAELSLSSNTNEFMTNYRECEEWALDGYCGHLKTFMSLHCSFFCDSLVW